jgi:hypothetical protein
MQRLDAGRRGPSASRMRHRSVGCRRQREDENHCRQSALPESKRCGFGHTVNHYNTATTLRLHAVDTNSRTSSVGVACGAANPL